jgi:ribosomal protein S27AE
MADCSCKDWDENLPKINAPLVLQQVRTGVRYEGKPFQFCPWCGSALAESKQDTVSSGFGPAQTVRHGIDCPKVRHEGIGYSHPAHFDRPFEDRGAIFCGRCHALLPPPARGE